MSEDGEIGVWSKEQRGKPVRGRKGPKSLLGRGWWREKEEVKACTVYAKGRALVMFFDTRAGRRGDVARNESGEDSLDGLDIGAKNAGEAYITLQHLDQSTAGQPSQPKSSVRLPDFELQQGDTISMLSAASDIDDGQSSRDRRTRQAVIVAVSAKGEAWVWKVDTKDGLDAVNVDVQDEDAKKGEVPEIRLISHSTIPCGVDDLDAAVDATANVKGEGQGKREGGANANVPTHVLPVDPMGWHQSVVDWKTQSLLQDIVLTISPAGVLEFWRPRIGDHMVTSKYTFHPSTTSTTNGTSDKHDNHGHVHAHGHDAQWVRTGMVRTERTDIRAARCSSRKKTVLVRDIELDGPGTSVGSSGGSAGRQGKGSGKDKEKVQEMTIWDSNVGEFSTGLEMCKIYP